VSPTDVSDPIGRAKLHGELHAPLIDIGIGQRASQIIERRKAHLSARAQQKRVVFGVSVGASDEPVENERADEGLDIL
jgi:hypothetical protein